MSEPQDLRGPILLTALALLALDGVVVFLLPAGSSAFCAAGGSRRALALAILARARPRTLAAGLRASARGKRSAAAKETPAAREAPKQAPAAKQAPTVQTTSRR